MTTHVLDTIDPVVLGERLAEARRARGLTQLDVATELEVARTTITAIEKGDRRPRPGELVKLAQLYGRSVNQLVRAVSDQRRPNFAVQFREMARTSEPDSSARAADLQRFEDLCRWYVELEEQAGSPLPRRYPEPYDVSGTQPDRAGEEVAASERVRLGLGDGPLGNLWSLLEADVGLRVFAFPMQDRRLAGMFVFTEPYGGCIAVNRNHPVERMRWSAVHEFGHFLTDRYRPDISVLRVGRRQPERERLAESFAQHFLMPTSGLVRRFEATRRAKGGAVSTADVTQLGYLYAVSFQAIAWRLEDLGLLPSGTWDHLHEMGFKPVRAREALRLPSESEDRPALPRRYENLAVSAHREGTLSIGQLAERLGTDHVGARERVLERTSSPELGDDGEVRQMSFDLSTELVARR